MHKGQESGQGWNTTSEV